MLPLIILIKLLGESQSKKGDIFVFNKFKVRLANRSKIYGWMGGQGMELGWCKVVLRIDLQKSKTRSRLCLWERGGTATKYETIFILKFDKHSMLNLICKKK